jgi:alpha,alpha-trehalase
MSILSLSSSIKKVRTFILHSWENTARSAPQDEGSLIGLPHPYTVPSAKGSFQELYYWDTYFTSVGLLANGRTDLAIGNTMDIMSLVERFGFMPNGNRTFYLNRSQPPYLGPLIALVSCATGDPTFATKAAPTLQREYGFWANRRQSPTGLCRYGNHADQQGLKDFYPIVAPRVGLTKRSPEECLTELAHTMAEAETGWDFTPRFHDVCENFCAIDLNSNLFLYEVLLAAWSGEAERSGWLARAEHRRKLMFDLCWDEERGGFFDYDFVNKRLGTVVTAASLHPLWCGLADERQAALTVERIVPLIEFAHGISACSIPDKPRRACQWDYPNAWPPLQYIAYRALQRYGFLDEARRIAGKYVATVCRGFDETGDLWEKYNAADGSTRTTNEPGYISSTVVPEVRAEAAQDASHDQTISLMGWTAGVFLDALSFLEGEASCWLLDPQYKLK